MDNANASELNESLDDNRSLVSLPVTVVAGLQICLLALTGIGLHYVLYGTASLIHSLISFFLSLNLLICYWEICLFFRRDYIETRHRYWIDRQKRTGRVPALEFLGRDVPLRDVFSPTLWADVWATYSLYDGSYADRRTYGFNADVGNGFVTLPV